MHQHDARLSRRRRHPVAVLRRERERLFAEDMLARAGGGDRHLRVQMMGQAQVYRLYLRVGQNLGIVRDRPRLALPYGLDRLARLLALRIAAGHDPRPLCIAAKSLDMVAADDPAPDQRHLQAFHASLVLSFLPIYRAARAAASQVRALQGRFLFQIAGGERSRKAGFLAFSQKRPGKSPRKGKGKARAIWLHKHDEGRKTDAVKKTQNRCATGRFESLRASDRWIFSTRSGTGRAFSYKNLRVPGPQDRPQEV